MLVSVCVGLVSVHDHSGGWGLGVDLHVGRALGSHAGLVGLDLGPETVLVGDVVDVSEDAVWVGVSVAASDGAVVVGGFLSVHDGSELVGGLEAEVVRFGSAGILQKDALLMHTML